jgi:hypothetical protein
MFSVSDMACEMSEGSRGRDHIRKGVEAEKMDCDYVGAN